MTRIKPVHLATGYFLALTGQWYGLEWLNKTAVISNKKGLMADYLPGTLLEHLASQPQQRVSSRFDLPKIDALRRQVNAAMDNDAAVFAAFPPYSQFGNDYTLTLARFLTAHKQMDGFAGYFLACVLERSEDGRAVRKFSERWISQPADPFERFVTPLLDDADSAQDWSNTYESKFGALDATRLDMVSALMQAQTAAVAQLCRNLDTTTPHHSRLRSLMLALSCWLVAYLLRESSRALGQSGRLLMFMDFLGQPGTRCRSQSRASFARHREMLFRSYEAMQNSDRFADFEDGLLCFSGRDKKTGELRPPEFKFLEEHFWHFAARIGIAQPLTQTVKVKHYECQPDTLRMMVNSVIYPDEPIVPFPQLAERLKETWSVCFGGCVDDHAELQEAGHLGLDEDDDLRANQEALVQLLKTMDLAVEPSDGLVLCAIDNDLLP